MKKTIIWASLITPCLLFPSISTSCSNNNNVEVIGDKTTTATNQGEASFKLRFNNIAKDTFVNFELITEDNIVSLVANKERQENNEVDVHLQINNTTTDGSVKFSLKVNYLDTNFNSINQTIDNLCITYPIVKIKVKNIIIEGKSLGFVGNKYSFTANVFPQNALNKNYRWSIEIPQGSTAACTIDEYGVVQFSKEGEAILIATAIDGSGVSAKHSISCFTKEHAAEYDKVRFYEMSWSELCDITNKGFDTLKTAFPGLVGNFVGLIKEIKLNQRTYKVRVIGQNHDDIDSGVGQEIKKACLTFELMNVYSDSEGKAMLSYYDVDTLFEWSGQTDMNFEYPNHSILRSNLELGGSKMWFPKSIFQVLAEENVDLAPNIKLVKKETMTNEHRSSTNPEKFLTRLFPLRLRELYPEQHFPYLEDFEVCSTYKYYDNDDSSLRIKTDLQNNVTNYWMMTPEFSRTIDSLSVWEEGGFGPEKAGLNCQYKQGRGLGVSFGFCI